MTQATGSIPRADRPLTVHVLEAEHGTYRLAGQTIVQARPSPYGFDVGTLHYVPLAMGLWGDRAETNDAIERKTTGLVACRIADLDGARLLMRSGLVQQFIRSSLLAAVADTLVRARSGKVAMGHFDYAEVDQSFPIIFVAVGPVAMDKIRRRALEVHTGAKPVTLDFT